MVLLVSRMNNDVQRLSKICGSSLSPMARALIEERMTKFEKDGGMSLTKSAAVSPTKATASSIPQPGRRAGNISRSSRLPRSNQSTPVSKSQVVRERGNSPTGSSDEHGNFQDELPALDLRLGPSNARSTPHTALGLQRLSPPSSLPRLNFSIDPPTTAAATSSNLGTMTASDPIATTLFPASSESNSDMSVDSVLQYCI